MVGARLRHRLRTWEFLTRLRNMFIPSHHGTEKCSVNTRQKEAKHLYLKHVTLCVESVDLSPVDLLAFCLFSHETGRQHVHASKCHTKNKTKCYNVWYVGNAQDVSELCLWLHDDVEQPTAATRKHFRVPCTTFLSPHMPHNKLGPVQHA